MYTFIILLLILFFGTISSLILYRFQGRKNVIRLDIVQFCYVFIFYPIFFIWLKTFVFVQLRSGLGNELSPNQFFIMDTAVALAGLYLYGIFSMKALTKSLYLSKQKDPLIDLFQHTEYFHLWVSHIATFIGIAAILTLLAAINLAIPFSTTDSWFSKVLMIIIGVFCGISVYIMLLLSNPKQDGYRLLRIIKLLFGFIFSLFVISYLVLSPSFSTQYFLYWLSFIILATFTICSFFSLRSTRVNHLLEDITDLFRDNTWGQNITLLKPKQK